MRRPAHGRSGSGLSAKAIVAAAMAVADEQGLDAVSIRRVAALLGVRPMSLYTHIASKDELLDLMTNDLVGLMLVDEQPPGGWREQLSAIARRCHRAYVEHPWALAAFARRPRQGPNAVRYAKMLARAVAELELEPSDMWALLGIVDDYVLGHALRMGTRGVARDLDAKLTGSDLAELPQLAALSNVDDARESTDSFETGLQTVLDGVASRFLPSPAPGLPSSDGASSSAQPV